MADATIKAAAKKYGLSAKLLAAVQAQESGGRQSARSPAGAIGRMQLMPGTAKSLGVNPYDARQNVEGGAKYLRQLLDRFGGSTEKALAAYNAGPGAVESGKPLPAETQAYVKSITARLGGAAPTVSAAVSAAAPRTITTTDKKQAVFDALVNDHHGDLLGNVIARLRSGAYTTTRQAPASPSFQDSGGSAGNGTKGGVRNFDGKPVASWIANELEYARSKGWKGTVTSGYRTDAEQTKIYKSGVRPAAVPRSLGGAGSNHERTGPGQGAVDVTDAQQLSRILSAKGSSLKWAGAKDPVHFSVPHGGSY